MNTSLHDLVMRTFATVEAKDLDAIVTFHTCPFWNDSEAPRDRVEYLKNAYLQLS